MTNTLYITFDGLCDPLGRSQILPYLCGISKHGYSITVISCEKKERFQKEKEEVQKIIAEHGIEWHHVPYEEEGGFMSRFRYLRQLAEKAKELNKVKKFRLTHCRSYLSALIGLALKRRTGIPFLFDMRGLWADERMDGGIWRKEKLLQRLAYSYFKKKEKQFLDEADAVISLTHAGIHKLEELLPGHKITDKTKVIPCCTQLDIFDPSKIVSKRQELGLLPNEHVLIYSGSIGTWYLTKKMIDCVVEWKKKIPELRLLIVTKDKKELTELLSSYPSQVQEMIISLPASYQEMPSLLASANAAIFFIQPAPSKIASSPTKMAECWAMGLPVITNAGIGDNDLYFSGNKGGVLIGSFDSSSYTKALQEYLALNKDKEVYRKIAFTDFNTQHAVSVYVSVYRKLIQ